MRPHPPLRASLSAFLALASQTFASVACESKPSWLGVGEGAARQVPSVATAQPPSAPGLARAPAPRTVGAEASTPTAAGPSAAPSAAAPKRPTLILERRFEPRQRAFSFLVPRGWQVEGGTFFVDPRKANGPGNSVDTKCDLAVKSDVEGRVMVRWHPSWSYADFARGQWTAMPRLFPVGSSYQGMKVRPMPSLKRFLLGVLRGARSGAEEMKVLAFAEPPELAAALRKQLAGINANLRRIGVPPIRATAGTLAVEYVEGGVRFREAIVSALVDNRGAAASWSNEGTVSARAPADEAERWRPALDVIRSSARLNPEWLARYKKASAQRAKRALETTRYIARVAREIYEHRAKTHAEIRHEQYLFLTGQEEYVNPYTREVERDTSEYKHRWTTFGGEKLLTDEEGFDPNRVRELSGVEWKRTVARPR